MPYQSAPFTHFQLRIAQCANVCAKWYYVFNLKWNEMKRKQGKKKQQIQLTRCCVDKFVKSMQFYGCEMKFINRLKWIRQISLAGWLLILFSLHNFPRPFCRIDLMAFHLTFKTNKIRFCFFFRSFFWLFSFLLYSGSISLFFSLAFKKNKHGHDTDYI